MALGRGRRDRGGIEAWPGYVDALSTLLMVLIFVLLVFVLALAPPDGHGSAAPAHCRGSSASAAMVRARTLISLRISVVACMRPCVISSRMRAR